MTSVSLFSFSVLHAQEAAGVAPAVDVVTATDGASQPQAGPPTTPDEAQALDQSIYGEGQALTDAPAESTAPQRPWKLNLHASAGSRYDDNVFISSTGRQADMVTRLSAGGGIALGDYSARQGNYFISDYTGIGELFGRHTNQDAYEQAASLASQARFAHLTLRGDFQFQDLADEDIELGARARRQIYTGNFSARYDISDKTYLEATAQVTAANYDLYLDSNDERAGLSFNYLPDPSLTLGLGLMGGVLNVEDSASQTYGQLLGSLRFAATGKLTIKASGGVEDRQFTGGGSLVTPVFDLTADYNPFDGLDLHLTGFRHVLNSAYYTGYDYIATGVSAGLKYQLSPRFTVLLDGGWQESGYRDVATGARIARTDDYFFARPALRYTASPGCGVELYYFYRDNQSTLDTSSFDDTQVGVTVDLTY